MEKIKSILKDESGSVLNTGIGLLIIITIISSAIFEYHRLNILIQGIRDSVQTTLITSCTNNYDKLYGGVREGYSGGYKLNNKTWIENIDTGDFYTQLDSLLGLHAEGNKHIKYYQGENLEEFTLSNLEVEVTNAPLAPEDGQGRQFKGVAYVDIEIPLSFGWQAVPPLTIKHLEVTAGYSAVF